MQPQLLNLFELKDMTVAEGLLSARSNNLVCMMGNDHARTMQGPTNIDVVALLVELGARVETSAVGTGVETPLHLAARSGRLDIVNRLVACQLPVAVRTKVRITSNDGVPATCS